MLPFFTDTTDSARVARRLLGTPSVSKYAPSTPAAAASPSTASNAGSSGSSASPSSSPLTDPNFYLNMINNDPLYKQTGMDLSAAGIGDASQTGSQIARAFAERGIVPDLTKSGPELGLSPQVIDWIRKNVDLGNAAGLAKTANDTGVSEEAQLLDAHKNAQASIRNRLAARGLVSSGALASLLGTEEKGYTRGRYQADQQLADYVAGAYRAFMNAEQARQAQLRQSAVDAANRAIQQQGAAPPPPATTPPPPASEDAYDPFGKGLRDLIARASKTHVNIAV